MTSVPDRPPTWLKGRDPSDITLPAEWCEDWTAYHLDGLRLVLRSGRVHSDVFVEGGVPRLLAESVLPRPPHWADFIAGRLLAGVGCEVLLKGLYLKHGYSIRNPDKKPLAKRLSIGDQRNTPFKSVGFGEALEDRNLDLIDGRHLKPLRVGQEWRNSAAHVVENAVAYVGAHLVAFAEALYALNEMLLAGASEDHQTDVQGVFAGTRSTF